VVGTKKAKTRCVYGEPEGVSGKGGNAMLFVIAGTLAGVLLGLSRFKVLVLVPAFLIAACAIIVTGHELKVIALTILATAALLQIGYIVGCIARVHAHAHLHARKAPRHRLSKSKPGVSL
jgi:hypothetical protein